MNFHKCFVTNKTIITRRLNTPAYNFEYQYSIADHQGNTRVLFTSAAATAVSTLADFDADANDQESQFSNVPAPVPYTAANHTPGGSYVVRMNQSTPVGPSLSKKVFAGDKVDMDVWSYYESGSGYGTNTTVAGMITAITTALIANTGGVDAGGLKSSGVNSALTNFGMGANQGDGQPAAFLNYILFDQNYKVMDAGWQVVPATSFSKQHVSIPTITVKEAGYIFAYLSYEDQSNNWIYFDDFTVKVTPTNIIQSNEYYPFGLQTASSWTRDNTVTNNFLANGGTELNTTSALYDLEFRNFDPILGRMNQVDPMADKYSSHTPYNFAFNNPVSINDPNGADPPGYVDPYINHHMDADHEGPRFSPSGINAQLTADLFGDYEMGSLTETGYHPDEDALKVRNGQMTPEEYAAKYGEGFTGEAIFHNSNGRIDWTATVVNGKVTDYWRRPKSNFGSGVSILASNGRLGDYLLTQSGGLGELSPNSAYTMRGNDVNFATLTKEFFTGTGPEYSGFGADHPMTQDLKKSWIVALATAKFVLGGSEPLIRFDSPFGVVGLGMGETMTEQFIGGARVSIIPTSQGNLYIVDNTTGANSLGLHMADDIPRAPDTTTPLGNIYQRFVWLQK